MAVCLNSMINVSTLVIEQYSYFYAVLDLSWSWLCHTSGPIVWLRY